MAEDAEQAMGVAASGDVQFAQYSSNIICLDEDLDRLHENTRLVMKKIQNLGFACRLETINAVEAWRGSLPGDGYRNVRRVLLHTLNLADLLPITSVWAGLHENPSRLMPKKSPPLLFAATTGATPFRVNLHVSDLGHTLMCGPSGAGKSTALGLIAAQWFRYPRAQVFAFDKGYSLFVLTKAAGGEFYDLAGEKTDLAFCPLREIDSDADLTWAVTWLDDLCSLNGLAVTPKHRNALTQALLQLRLSPSRTLTELSANVQDLEVREALQFYTLSGPLGQLLDADEDVLSSGRFLTFETENLLQLDDKAVIPVLLYLFRRIEKRLDGSPTLVSLDEAWAYLRNEVFRERLRDWLKTLRRMNGIVLLSTQNLSDICNSEISDVILEMCPTKILLPNGEAKNPASKEFYDRVGLNSRELDILQTSIPKQHYYVISPLGRRLISLGIHNVALSFVGVNGREERQLVEDLVNEFPETWQSEWLRVRAECPERRTARRLGRLLRKAAEGFREEPPMRKSLIALVTLFAVTIQEPQRAQAGAFATEYTQLLNHAQLILQYLRQAEQLAEAIKQTADMLKNSKLLPGQVFGTISNDLNALASIVQGGQALSYSLANLDSLFKTRFPGYGYSSTGYYVRYRSWSQTSLDTTLGALRAAGLQGQQLQSEQSVLNSLRSMAQSTNGRMEALQVMGQISEQQVQQLMKLRELMMADMSSKQSYQAAVIQKQAASEAATEKFFNWTPEVSDGTKFQSGWK